MRIRHRSKRRRALDAVGAYLKFKAVSKVVKGAGKTVKSLAAYKATKGIAKKAPTPVKALPVVAGVGAAGAVAARKRRQREDEREPTPA
jgi:hypothetical protein